MSKITLLNGISENKDKVLRCFNPVELRFSKGEILTDFSDLGEKLYIVESGTAHLVCLDTEGHSTILETYGENDLYGKLFRAPSQGLNFSVFAASDCRVTQLDYALLCSCCETPCGHHAELLSNLFRISVEKNVQLSAHLSILSQRTTRAKILSFLSCVSAGRKEFEIPYKIGELADYLCVDRCAMLRELKTMNDMGILHSKGRHFYLP